MKNKTLAALILNCIVVVATAAIVVSYFFHSRNPLVKSGFDSFQFFTTDSNVLAALSSLVMIPSSCITAFFPFPGETVSI